MKYRHQCDGMLTVECQTPFQQTLSKTQASDLTAKVAKDLHAVLNISSPCALVFCGAAFSVEQLLQPKFPIQHHITQYASAAFQGDLQLNQVLSIGANQGLMPAGLHPKEAVQNFLHLPFCLYTDDDELATRFESSLMHKGMVSPPTYAKLDEILNSQINHANYMTYFDLVAMMHNHYEQLGLTHVWEIIETALVGKAPKSVVTTSTMNHFYLVDHLLFTPFFTVAQFKQYFEHHEADAYIQWLMAQRLSLAAFAAHGLQLKPFATDQWPINSKQVCLGQFEEQLIKLSYWHVQQANNQQHPEHVVYHNHPQAGLVAISTPNNDALDIYYPIAPDGITEIEKILHETTSVADKSSTHDLHFNWLI